MTTTDHPAAIDATPMNAAALVETVQQIDRTLDTAPHWFLGGDARRHAVESHLDPGRGDVVRAYCGDDITVRGSHNPGTHSSRFSVCTGCDGAARAALGLPRYGENAHRDSA
jgi:hypothetical protein